LSTDASPAPPRRLFTDWLCAVLPSVEGRPLDRMPEGLYRYVLAVSGRQQVPLCLLTLLIFPLTLLPLELQRRIVNDAIGGSDLGHLLLLGAAYLAAVVTQGGLKFMRNVYLDRVAEGVGRRLRRRIVDNEAFGAEMEEGTKQSLIVAEAQAVGGFVAEGLAFPLLQAGIVLSVASYMLVIDFRVALVALGFFVPSVIIVALTQPRLNRLTEKKTKVQRELGEAVLEDGAGDTGEPSEAAADRHSAIDPLVQGIYDLKVRIAQLKHALKALNNLLGHLGPLSVLVFGGYMVIQGQTTLGTVMAFVSGYGQMNDPARQLLNFYRRMSMMTVQYRMVRKATNGTC